MEINKNSPNTRRNAMMVRQTLNIILKVSSEIEPSSFLPIFVPMYTDIISGNKM